MSPHHPSDSQQSAPTTAGTSIPAETLTYSVAEAAAVLGVSHATIYRLVCRRILKPIPGLRHKRIAKRQVHTLAQGGSQP